MAYRFIPTAILFLLLGLLPHSHAGETSFRCGSNLISLGDTMHEVRKSCGDPFSSQAVGEKKSFKILHNEKLRIESITYLTEWIYESNNGIYVLTFEGSRLGEKEFIYQR